MKVFNDFATNKLSENGSLNKDAIDIRRGLPSELVQEIVSNKPDFIIQWSTSFFLFSICLLITACWFIKYPEVVIAKAKLTTINAPKPVISLITGKLIKMDTYEGQDVRAGKVICYLESTADHSDVLALAADIKSMSDLLINNQVEDLPKYFKDTEFNLGELQLSYQTFSQAFQFFQNYLENGFYRKKRYMLREDMNNLKRLGASLMEQKLIQEQDLLLSQKTFEANELLNKQNVISDFDYRTEKSRLLVKSMAIPQINSSIISNENSQNEKLKEMLELESSMHKEKLNFHQALKTFEFQLEDWKRKYTLIAPISGKVAFASLVQENQQLEIGQTVFFINPGNSEYYAEIVIPQANFGKVQIGQEVLLKFPSYPFQEYGSVKGRITFISDIPTEEGYLSKVTLPKALKTTFGKTIQFRNGLQANAEIITKDMRLLERFYYNISKQLER